MEKCTLILTHEIHFTLKSLAMFITNQYIWGVTQIRCHEDYCNSSGFCELRLKILFPYSNHPRTNMITVLWFGWEEAVPLENRPEGDHCGSSGCNSGERRLSWNKENLLMKMTSGPILYFLTSPIAEYSYRKTEHLTQRQET